MTLAVAGFALCAAMDCAAQQAAPATGDAPSVPAQMHIGHSPTAAPAPAAAPEDAPADAASDAQAPRPATLLDYAGTLGAENISASWTITSGQISGHWSRVADGRDVAFNGRQTGAAAEEKLMLSEPESGATWLLTRVPEAATASRIPQREQWTGTWTSSDHARSLPASLTLRDTMPGATPDNRYAVAGVTDPAAVEANAEMFRRALLDGNAAAAADRVAFPLVVTIAGKRSLLHSREAFVERFHSLLTPEFLAVLRNAPAHDMYATERGLRLGDGEVWFSYSGQAFAIDNAPVRIFAGKRFLSNRGYTGRHRTHHDPS